MKERKMFYGWWIVIGIVINLALLGPAAVAIANLFQTSVTTDFEISNSAFAINNVLVLGIGMFISPIVSRLLSGDKFKMTYLAGAIAYIVGLVGYSFSPNIYVFYFFSLILGAGFITSSIIPASILVNNWFVEKRGLALSIALSGLGIGGFILSPLVTVLISSLNWRMTYLIYAILIAVIVLPTIIFVIHFKPEDKGLKALGAEEISDSTDQSSQQLETGKVKLSVADSLKKTFFILLIFGAFVNGLVNNGGLGQFPPALTIQHGATFSSIIVSLYSIVGIAGKLILGQVSDKYGVKVGVVYTTIAFIATFGLMLFSENQLAVYAMAVLFGIANANATVLAPLLTSAIFPSNEYSAAYGFVQSGAQFGMAAGSFAVASIADLSGGYSLSWVVMMVLCAVAGICWYGSVTSAKKYS